MEQVRGIARRDWTSDPSEQPDHSSLVHQVVASNHVEYMTIVLRGTLRIALSTVIMDEVE